MLRARHPRYSHVPRLGAESARLLDPDPRRAAPGSAGGCSIRLDGRDYQASQPEFLGRDQARELIKPMFSPLERASFRLLGIRQFMRLHAAPASR
jgi:hypothetical protein